MAVKGFPLTDTSELRFTRVRKVPRRFEDRHIAFFRKDNRSRSSIPYGWKGLGAGCSAVHEGDFVGLGRPLRRHFRTHPPRSTVSSARHRPEAVEESPPDVLLNSPQPIESLQMVGQLR